MIRLPKKRIVVAGQIPPPLGGQNVSIKQLLDDLSEDSELETIHLKFEFTPKFSAARSAGLQKLFELARVVFRLISIRRRGPIDLLIYPVGGPQTIPLLRDLLVLPWVFLISRTTVLRFHAAGFADRLADGKLLPRVVGLLYRKATAAFVMTQYNRKDPEASGINRIYVVPHQLSDARKLKCLNRKELPIRFLYMGHLCEDKGTPTLIRAFAKVADDYPHLQLELAGEALPPFSDSQLDKLISDLSLTSRVTRLGIVNGEKKDQAFGRANLFIFPSVAPYESYGRVTVEAMMWNLPIIISDWRGNADVVGSHFGGVIYSVKDDAASSLEQAFRTCLAKQSQWENWGLKNRTRYEQFFGGKTPIVDIIKKKLLSTPGKLEISSKPASISIER